MKKTLLYAFLTVISVLLFSCRDKVPQQTPFSPYNVIIPATSEDTPIVGGSRVTIIGNGFKADDRVLLRHIPQDNTPDIEAAVVETTTTGLTFTAPAVDVALKVVLVKEGNEYALGTLYFAASDPSLLARVYGAGYSAEGVNVYAVNPRTGGCLLLAQVVDNPDVTVSDPLYLPASKKLCFLLTFDNLYDNTRTRLVVFDTATGIVAQSYTSAGIERLLMVSGQPCILENDSYSNTIKLKTFDPVSGFVFDERSLGEFSGQHRYFASHALYHQPSSSLLSQCYHPGAPDNDRVHLASVSLDDPQTRNFTPSAGNWDAFLFYGPEGNVFTAEVTRIGGEYTTRVSLLDIQALAPGQPLVTLDGHWASLSYDATDNMLYGCTSFVEGAGSAVGRYDLTSGTMVFTRTSQPVTCLVVAR